MASCLTTIADPHGSRQQASAKSQQGDDPGQTFGASFNRWLYTAGVLPTSSVPLVAWVPKAARSRLKSSISQFSVGSFLFLLILYKTVTSVCLSFFFLFPNAKKYPHFIWIHHVESDLYIINKRLKILFNFCSSDCLNLLSISWTVFMAFLFFCIFIPQFSFLHTLDTYPSDFIFPLFFFLPVSTAQLPGLLGGTTCISVISSFSISHFHFNSRLTAGTKTLRMHISKRWLFVFFFGHMPNERVGREGAMNGRELKFTLAMLAEWEGN